MQSSGPPRQGADHSSRNQESGKVQFSRSGLDGATGNKHYQRDPDQGCALSAGLASAEPGPPKGCSPQDTASRSVFGLAIAEEVQFLRNSPSDATGKAHSSKQDQRGTGETPQNEEVDSIRQVGAGSRRSSRRKASVKMVQREVQRASPESHAVMGSARLFA